MSAVFASVGNLEKVDDIEPGGGLIAGCAGGAPRVLRRSTANPISRGGKPRKRLDSDGCLGFYSPVSDLFATAENSFKAKLRSTVQRLAASPILIGTSSWKYDGWLGTLYDQQRYCYRGKFAESRFERDCLAEYAETFKTVCVDAAYYQFPSAKYLDGLVSKVPADFRFSFKVTDDITLKRFTNLPRFGLKAGKPNDNFLNAELDRVNRFATASGC